MLHFRNMLCHTLPMKINTLLLTILVLTLPCFPRTQVFFSPDDKPEKALLKQLRSAHDRIQLAVYGLTNKKITQAIIDAHNRGLNVQVVSDESYILSDRYNKIEMLKEHGVETFLYPEKKSGIMHNKFALIDGQVWTGSMNWTQSGVRRNQENCMLVDEQAVVSRYEHQFEVLKQRCFGGKKRRRKKRRSPFTRGRQHAQETSFYTLDADRKPTTTHKLQSGLNGLLSALRKRVFG